ncbi:hypothetical protein SEMRO_719_G192450.1 [Seminavis robusta]|uniref:Uncharacterized protein n=1 Tax=Seminavis robusta TaxID=568900 RepID=A0A9N8HIT9_9STRA|nr:hypothetical protein SEMRO_719_G192450.1 [Seminavis robusta]
MPSRIDWEDSRIFRIHAGCGGTADRLKPLPVMLLMAHKSRRLLLIKWGRPAELEAFFMDWRKFRQGPRATNIEELIELTTNSEEFAMVKARVQAHDHGSVYYNEQRQQPDEPTFEQVYHLCWRVLFTPAHAVAKRIEQQFENSGMVPGHYVGIHIRALYGVSERDPAMIEHWTRNAIHCASQLEKQQLHSTAGPFYLSSDSSVALAVGMAYGMELGAQVVTRQTAEEKAPKQPYHLDKAPKSAKPSEFYDTFVDLYLLAIGRCVTYNMGGYGTWALYISPYTNHNNNKAVSFSTPQRQWYSQM